MTYRTGEKAPRAANYYFVRYTDGTTTPAPTRDEQTIRSSQGEVFPPIRSTNRGAIWRD